MWNNNGFEAGMKAALYTRVSTDMQVNAESLSTQEKQLREYCKYHKLKVYKIYTDAGLSGSTTEHRPAFLKMMADAKEKKFEVLVVAKIDRISRNLSDLLEMITTLERLDIAFISISQQFDTSTPMGKLTLSILGSFSQFEREMIAERVRENMLERAKDGKWNGGVIPYGFEVEDKKLRINRDEADVVEKMFDLYLERRSIRITTHIANTMDAKPRYSKDWSPTTIRRMLENPIYYGAACYNKRKSHGHTTRPRPKKEWIVVEGVVEPIVPKEKWETVQSIIKFEASAHPRTKRYNHMLSGLIRCGHCGGSMQGYNHPKRGKGGGSWSYYKCSWHINKGPSVCPGNTVSKKDTEKKVINMIATWASDPAAVVDQAYRLIKSDSKLAVKMNSHLGGLEKRVSVIDEALTRIMDAFQEALIDKEEVMSRSRPLRSEKEILDAEIIKLRVQSNLSVDGSIDTESLKRTFGDFSQVFKSLDAQEQKTLLAQVIKQIVVHLDGRLDLHVYFSVLKEAFGNDDASIAMTAHDDLVLVIPIEEERHRIQSVIELDTFAEKIEWLRWKHGLTKKGLAKHIDVSACTVANWEIRGRTPHQHAVTRRLAGFFEVTVADLMGVEPIQEGDSPKEKLRKIRLSLGYSQAEMGKLMGLTEEQYHWSEFVGKKGSKLDKGKLDGLLKTLPQNLRAGLELIQQT